ncbi:pericentriolar material 1 protein isoform X2 [Stigmatopora argus]
MATGGVPFDDSADEPHNWSVTNASLDDRLNNRAWGGTQQKKANRSSEKNKKKLSTPAVSESRLTNDISPSSTPWTGRRRQLPVKFISQRSVPDQAELDKIHQRINFSDLDESIGSDSQGRVTAANNQRQLATENKKPFNFLSLHVNTNKSKGGPLHRSGASTTPSAVKEAKKSSPAPREVFTPGATPKETRPGRGSADRGAAAEACVDVEGGDANVVCSLLVSKLVQIREYIGKASSMRDDLLEKNDVPANVERLSHLIEHLKEQEKSYLRFLQKMLARENEDDDVRTQDSAVGSGSLVESSSLNVDVRSSDTSSAPSGWPDAALREPKEELENLCKQQELMKKMLEQQDQLRALQGRQEALLAMQHSAEQALAVIDDAAAVPETTGSVSGVSITSELNDELNDLIQRFHNQLRDSQSKSVPDNRRQAESLSLSREVSWSQPSRASGPPERRPVLHSASGPHGGLDGAKLTKLQVLQDKKETMDKILHELHSLRDQTLNNNYCEALSTQRSLSMGGSSDCPSNGAVAAAAAFLPSIPQPTDGANSSDKLRKLKEVHKRLNELRELVQYFQQTSDMMVDAVNENVKEDEEDDEEEEGTEDGSMLEAMFDSEQENRQPPANVRNSQCGENWGNVNRRRVSGSPAANADNHDGRLNTEINNRTAGNLRSFNLPSAIECQYNRDGAYNWTKDEEGCKNDGRECGAVRPAGLDDNEASGSSSGSPVNGAAFTQEVHQHKAKQKMRQLQELVAMVQSDDTDTTAANEEEALHQRQNNTRVGAAGSPAAAPKSDPRGSDVALYTKAREKIYKEKLRQQKQTLKQLHQERQMLGEIQGKIQDLQLTCPDLQSSLSSQVSEPGLAWEVPGATSTPAVAQPSPFSAAKSTPAVLKSTAAEAAATSVPDHELWSEMRRHHLAREELRQRRKHLESLMAESQRRRDLADSLCGTDDREGNSLPAGSRDERTMATWGSSPCNLEEDEDYRSERSAEEEDDSSGSSSADDEGFFPAARTQPIFTKRKNQERNVMSPPAFPSETPGAKPSGNRQPPPPRSSNPPSTARRQENLCWASELSAAEGSNHWQEQIGQLQRQLDFSNNMCQTLLQDQQILSYMLQGLMSGSYSVLPNNLTSPQVHLVMHQLNQCHTQLAWQQTNVQRLKQVLNELLQQQNPQQKQSSSPGFSLFPFFPKTLGEFPQGAQSANPVGLEQQKQQLNPNTSIKTDYMTFPPPLQRSPLNITTDRRDAGWSNVTFPNNAAPQRRRSPPAAECERTSEASFSSIPERADPATVTKTFKSGRKASAQANLASRSKNRRKRGKAPNKNNEGVESDSLSSTADLKQDRAPASRHHKDQHLLDKLTQEKLNSKSKFGDKPNDISSDGSSEFSLFEALRETIYSEVATLISQNESRPHFLIELFHELQLLNTDYLRQRALYSLQDLVSRHLAEKSASREMQPVGVASWAGGSQSELTPSESSTVSETEVVEKNLKKKREDLHSGGNDSTLSSTNVDPFSRDDLGNTVIHLDKAFVRMRQYERMKRSSARDSDNDGPGSSAAAAANSEDAGGAASHVRCPQIDTLQLNQHIKDIMTEVIPFLKENMDEVCTPQLLASLRRKVLALTQQNDESKEFVRFFHRQLGGILQDSLNIFAGRTLTDCGEDLLVEVSDILFNELAFFRLMRDLDDGATLSAETRRNNDNDIALKDGTEEEGKENKEEDNGMIRQGAGSSPRSERIEVGDEENLLPMPHPVGLSEAEGRALDHQNGGDEDDQNSGDHDDQNNVEDDDQNDVEREPDMSGEDQNGHDEQEPDGFQPMPDDDNDDDVQTPPSATMEGDIEGPLDDDLTGENHPNPEEDDAGADVAQDQGAEACDSEEEENLASGGDAGGQIPAPSDATGTPDTESPVMINVDEAASGGSGSGHRTSDEDDFVRVDGPPAQLPALTCQEELQKRIRDERRTNDLREEILQDQTQTPAGLLGDDRHLKEPECVD